MSLNIDLLIPPNNEWIIKESSVKRDWMENTDEKHAYRCIPLSSANVHGWEVLLPEDVVIEWDGISSARPDHVKIISGSKYASSSTGNATVSFATGITFTTDEDHYLWISGSPNYPIDGLTPLTSILQSNWYRLPYTHSWIVNKKNERFVIPKMTPIMFFMPYPKNLLNSFDVNVINKTQEQIKYESDYNTFRLENRSYHSFYRDKKDHNGHIGLDREEKVKAKPVKML